METETRRKGGAAMSKEAYNEMVESTFVELGNDVANAWVADGSPTRQRGIKARIKKIVREMRRSGKVGALGATQEWFDDADAIESLISENKALQHKAEQVLISARYVLREDKKLLRENEELRIGKPISDLQRANCDLQQRIAELERENEALRATISDMRRDLLELTGEKT